MPLTLDNVSPGKAVRIRSIEGGVKVRQCLSDLNVSPGEVLRIIRSAPFAGPIMAEVNGSKVMVGRGMARKVVVEEVA